MEVFKCQSSQGPGGIARSEICRQREPLYRALKQAIEVGGVMLIDGEFYRESSIYGTDSPGGYCKEEACPELAEYALSNL